MAASKEGGRGRVGFTLCCLDFSSFTHALPSLPPSLPPHHHSAILPNALRLPSSSPTPASAQDSNENS